MEYKSKSLEEKLDKPNWKQWLPVYGIYQVVKDVYSDRPSVITNKITNKTEHRVELAGLWIYLGSAAYQAVSIYCLYELAEKLF